MGGIVAAETLIALTTDRVIPVSSSTSSGGGSTTTTDGNHTAAPDEGDTTPLNSLMFPYIQAVLSFDTPYLGISPGVVAHGAETHYSTATAALTQLSALSSLWSAGNNNNDKKDGQAEKPPVAALPAVEAAKEASTGTSSSSNNNNNNSSGWGSWGKMALYAGAGAALAGGAAAAYLKRDQLTEGWSWVSSHLEFVGCLARGEELRRRTAYMARAQEELGVGFGNLYTRLGQGAVARQQQVAGLGGTNMVGAVMGSQRTFCNLPSRKGGPERTGRWEEAVNDMAADETGAHMCKSCPLFFPPSNFVLLVLCPSPCPAMLGGPPADFRVAWDGCSHV